MKTNRETTAAQVRRYLASALMIGFLAAPASGQSLSFRYSATGPKIKTVSVTLNSEHILATAAEDSSGDQVITVWQDTGSAIVEQSSGTGSPITAVDVASLANHQFITAVIDSATGQMEIDAWQAPYDGGGSIGLQGATTLPGTASSVSITTLPSTNRYKAPDLVATAAIVGGSLQVNVFQISTTGEFTNMGAATGPPAASSASVAALSPTQFVTAVLNTNQELEVTSWTVQDGAVVEQGSATASGVQQVAAAYWTPDASTTLATAVVNTAGNLELLSWDVSSAGTVAMQASGTAGSASQAAICVLPDGRAVTAAVGGSGDLDLAVWKDGTAAGTLEMAADDDTTIAVTQLAAVRDGGKTLLTASRKNDGDLQVAVWAFRP